MATDDENDVMTGRELDAAVAESLGWTHHCFANGTGQMQPPDKPVVDEIEQVRMVPHYSTDNGEAVGLLLGTGVWFDVAPMADGWIAIAIGEWITDESKSFPEAACRAFLKHQNMGRIMTDPTNIDTVNQIENCHGAGEEHGVAERMRWVLDNVGVKPAPKPVDPDTAIAAADSAMMPAMVMADSGPFRCPVCCGDHFGRGAERMPDGTYRLSDEVSCHDEFGRGCRWRGVWPPQVTAAAPVEDVQQVSNDEPQCTPEMLAIAYMLDILRQTSKVTLLRRIDGNVRIDVETNGNAKRYIVKSLSAAPSKVVEAMGAHHDNVP